MHRENIDPTGTKNRCMIDMRALLLSALPLLLVPSLSAVVDPDLFDGRVSSSEQGSQGSRGSQGSQGSGGSQGSPGSGAAGGAGAEASSGTQAASQEAVDAEASAAQGEGSTGSGAAAEGTSGNRDFSEIGGIQGAGDAAVEVKTSKTTPAGQVSGTSQQAGGSSGGASSEQTTEQGGAGGSGSQPIQGSGAGDYGETLPSGI